MEDDVRASPYDLLRPFPFSTPAASAYCSLEKHSGPWKLRGPLHFIEFLPPSTTELLKYALETSPFRHESIRASLTGHYKRGKVIQSGPFYVFNETMQGVSELYCIS